jgi:hypothetical protein
MSAVEELEQGLTFDQAEQLVHFDRPPAVELATATQQLLDELLGCFEEDDSPRFSADVLRHDLCLDADE